MYGICVSMDERFSEAEDVFELATTIDSQSITAWIVRGELCNIMKKISLVFIFCSHAFVTTQLSASTHNIVIL